MGRATASISRAARRTPVPITAASNWLCFSGQLEESVRDQGAQPSTIDIPSRIPPPYRAVPSRGEQTPRRSLFGGRVFLDTRNDHFNWTMDGCVTLGEPMGTN